MAEQRKGDGMDYCDRGHDWWVYSTAMVSGCLMVHCRACGMEGVVDDPSLNEWKRAFHAPSNPYRWEYPDRVEVADEVRDMVELGGHVTLPEYNI